MVKCGVEVIDVIVEHPVYGQLTVNVEYLHPRRRRELHADYRTNSASVFCHPSPTVCIYTLSEASHFEQLSELENVERKALYPGLTSLTK